MFQRIAAALTVLALGVAPALAIDCGKAQTPIEKLICATPKLKEADDALSAAFEKVRAAAPPAEKDALRISEARWIKQREACDAGVEDETKACAQDETDKRLAMLTAKPESGPGDAAELTPWFIQKEGKPGGWDIGFDLVRFAKPETPGEFLFNRDVEALTAPALLQNTTLGVAAEKIPTDHIFAYAVSLTPTYASKAFISALADGYEDHGGAHPFSWSRAINIDMKEGHALSFGDLFPREASGAFAKLCADALIATRRARTGDPTVNLEDGADETILDAVRNLEAWSFRADKATILFDASLIGARAEGPYACDLDVARLKAEALPGAPLPK